MNMVIGDRIALMSILPQRGSALKLKMARDLMDKVSPSDEERQNFSIVESANGLIKWDALADSDTEIDISSSERELISEILRALDKAEDLTPVLLPLYDAFVGSED